MVLSIDPSTSSMGWALYKRPLTPIKDGFVQFDYTSPLDYLSHLVDFLDVMLSENSVTEVVCERTFINRFRDTSSSALIVVSAVQIKAWAEAAHLPFTLLSPKTVKKQVAGSGDADKHEVYLFMKKYLSAEASELTVPKGKSKVAHVYDITDAHAIAQTYIVKNRVPLTFEAA